MKTAKIVTKANPTAKAMRKGILKDLRTLLYSMEHAEAVGIQHKTERDVSWGFRLSNGSEQACGCLFGAMVLLNHRHVRNVETYDVAYEAEVRCPTLCRLAARGWWDSIGVFNALSELSDEISRADLYAFVAATPPEEWVPLIEDMDDVRFRDEGDR